MLRVYAAPGRTRRCAATSSILADRASASAAMLGFSRNIAIVSLLISVFSAALVYAAIDRIMIRPIRRMTQSMLVFAQARTTRRD
jgi:hypothetical protein